ncbi:MAG: hypothetical protein ACNS62_22185 [Candidatus Cyclobacteriaceae bacterium M3_2C_046]
MRNRQLLIPAILLGLILVNSSFSTAQAPYPESEWIEEIQFNLSTIRNTTPGNGLTAPGSDNWTITWADDGNQYSSWGDGGGFGGDNQLGRVKMGVARIEGNKRNYSAFNVWGGHNPESDQSTLPAKSYGILSVNGDLYLWVSYNENSPSICYDHQDIYKSSDYGQSWQLLYGWRNSPGFFCPTFLQAGQDFDQSPDRYVYAFLPERTQTIESQEDSIWNVQKPGKITLMRCHQDSLDQKENWRFYGKNGKWLSDKNHRESVFTDIKNGIMRTSVIYNPGLQKYILATQHVGRYHADGARVGFYESDNPWGPWKTVFFGDPWDLGIQERDQKYKTVYYNFSPKWLSKNGKTFVMVYTGPGSDEWGTIEGKFKLNKRYK